jgi:hypothetical protein
MVKSEGGQRESDGVVVPLIGVSNAPGGKGPDFDHARGGGKCQGMAGTARSNYPDRTPPVDNVHNSNASYGLRPSSLRSGVSTPCSTVSTELTCCGRRGSESGPTGVRPVLTG